MDEDLLEAIVMIVALLAICAVVIVPIWLILEYVAK